jgi:hypothetical protein
VNPKRHDHSRPARRALGLAIALLAMASCAAPHRVRSLPDGALAVDCPGGYHDWSACHAAAEARCGAGGYRVIGQTTNEGGAVGRGDWSREGSEVARTMEFRCVE